MIKLLPLSSPALLDDSKFKKIGILNSFLTNGVHQYVYSDNPENDVLVYASNLLFDIEEDFAPIVCTQGNAYRLIRFVKLKSGDTCYRMIPLNKDEGQVGMLVALSDKEYLQTFNKENLDVSEKVIDI